VYVRDRHGERNEADETDTNEQERGQKRKKAKNQKIETWGSLKKEAFKTKIDAGTACNTLYVWSWIDEPEMETKQYRYRQWKLEYKQKAKQKYVGLGGSGGGEGGEARHLPHTRKQDGLSLEMLLNEPKETWPLRLDATSLFTCISSRSCSLTLLWALLKACQFTMGWLRLVGSIKL